MTVKQGVKNFVDWYKVPQLIDKPKIAIIGLGYVGLPSPAIEFGKIFETIGFDINKSRIKELLAVKNT